MLLRGIPPIRRRHVCAHRGAVAVACLFFRSIVMMFAATSATNIITISNSIPSTADTAPCWECSRQVAPYQASRTIKGWQAIICLHCEGWVSSVLGPIPTTITD